MEMREPEGLSQWSICQHWQTSGREGARLVGCFGGGGNQPVAFFPVTPLVPEGLIRFPSFPQLLRSTPFSFGLFVRLVRLLSLFPCFAPFLFCGCGVFSPALPIPILLFTFRLSAFVLSLDGCRSTVCRLFLSLPFLSSLILFRFFLLHCLPSFTPSLSLSFEF